MTSTSDWGLEKPDILAAMMERHKGLIWELFSETAVPMGGPPPNCYLTVRHVVMLITSSAKAQQSHLLDGGMLSYNVDLSKGPMLSGSPAIVAWGTLGPCISTRHESMVYGL